jgi:peptidoglycan/LPS O-acetylase OafA/YrhL
MVVGLGVDKKRLALLILCGLLVAVGWILARTKCQSFEARYGISTIGLFLQAGGFILWMRVVRTLPRTRLVLRALAALSFVAVQAIFPLRSWAITQNILPVWIALGIGGSIALLALAFWKERPLQQN